MIHDASDEKAKIKWLKEFNHPENRHHGDSESKIAKYILTSGVSLDREVKKYKALESKKSGD